MVAWKTAMKQWPGELTTATAPVALALTLWMDRDGGFNATPPSAATIAEVLGKRRQSVSQALDQLAESGWLEQVKRKGKPALLHAAIPNRLVADAPFAGLVKGREPSIDAQELSTTRNVEDHAYSVNPQRRGPGTSNVEAQVSANYREHPQRRGPGPATQRPTKSYPSLSNSLSTEVLTPDQHPDLWERARVITEQRTDVGNPPAYRTKVYRQLVEQSNGQRNDCIHIWHLGRTPAGEYVDVCRCGTRRPHNDTPA